MVMIITYEFGNRINDVISSLQESSEKLFQWFSDNQMKANADKCHLIVSTDKSLEIQIGESLAKLITNLSLIPTSL